MKKVLYKLMIFTSVIFYFSCAPAYIPNLVNSPMVSNQGEYKVRAGMAISGINVSGAYAPIKNIGVMANYSYVSEKYTSGVGSTEHRNSIIEGGAGFCKQFSLYGKFECYAGGGFLQTNFITATEHFNIIGGRYFIQPSIGHVAENLHVIFSSRISYVSMKYSTLSVKGLFIEPTVTTSFGAERFKIFFQAGLSVPMEQLMHNDFSSGTYSIFGIYQPFILGVGLQFQLDKPEIQ